MSFRNLPAQRQTDARATGFSSEEGDEYVGLVLNARPIVPDPNIQLRILARPRIWEAHL